MAVCEKCWDEAMARAVHEIKSVREIYRELIIARIGTPCTEEEQDETRNAIKCPYCDVSLPIIGFEKTTYCEKCELELKYSSDLESMSVLVPVEEDDEIYLDR